MRRIRGQATLLSRTIHKMALDPVHDELLAPNPFADAILFFAGGAEGNASPVRIIQGPKTLLAFTDVVEVDPVHNEVFTTERRANAVLVFDRTDRGDVAPKRIINGPRTQLERPVYLAVDPVNDLLVVANSGPNSILIFNRTDSGDVAPRAIIGGSKTGITGIRKLALVPEARNILVSARTGRGDASYRFIGLWKYGDKGDVPPRVMVKGLGEAGWAIEAIPEKKELWTKFQDTPDHFHAYHLPQLFE
ncbi:MAG: hypothetical protein HY315_09440 [Acidobacteria bacterium]|nr:hypothetical protein [Acidobacteriota bacterium]